MSGVAEVLAEARDIYAAAPTHVPHPQHPPKGTYCALTALLEVTDSRRHAHKDTQEAYHVMYGVLGGENLVDFNATHSTEEVVAAFDRAIQAAS